MSKKVTKKIESDLPPDVISDDLKSGGYKDLFSEMKEGVQLPYILTFYKVQGSRIKDDWVLLTLPIDNKGRSYVVQVSSGNLGRAGKGPHVKATVVVYLKKSNIDRLRKYLDLWFKGMIEAGAVRDRISSRRAIGQVHRANGRTHWSW